ERPQGDTHAALACADDLDQGTADAWRAPGMGPDALRGLLRLLRRLGQLALGRRHAAVHLRLLVVALRQAVAVLGHGADASCLPPRDARRPLVWSPPLAVP